MIVVLPVCALDYNLAVQNLEWCIELDGKVDAECLIASETNFDVTRLTELCTAYFKKVSHFTYCPYTGPRDWPTLPNYAWRHVARHLMAQESPWFWWEADATPVKVGWLESLISEYHTAKKPFMGAWSTYGGTGYMPGVGFYPANVAHYSAPAFLSHQHPWDRVLGIYIEQICHKINHLITHEIKPLTFPDWRSVKTTIGPTTVLVHKCKDGTLIGQLRDQAQRGKQNLLSKVTGVVADLRNKSAIIAYVPPPGVSGSDGFMANLKDWPTHYPIHLLSDYAWPKAIPVVDPIKMAGTDKNKLATVIFLMALEYAREHGITHFLYLESDCRFKGDDWDKPLFDSYFEQKLAIGGGLAMCGVTQANLQSQMIFRDLVLKHNEGHEYPIFEQAKDNKLGSVVFVNGAPAIYSTRCLHDLLGPEERRCAMETWRAYDFDIGRLMTLKHGLPGVFKQIGYLPGILSTEGDRLLPFNVKFDRINLGLASCVHSVKTKWHPPRTTPTFYHSGDLGDIIYALKTIQIYGKGRLILGPVNKHKWPPRCAMQLPVFKKMENLIRLQPYIESVEFSEKYPDTEPDYDLNEFRNFWCWPEFREKVKIDNLSEMMAYTAGVHPMWESVAPWINQIPPFEIPPVVMARSERYRAPEFPWKEIVARFKRQCVFVGLLEEYQNFIREFGYVPYYEITDFTELAQVIKGSKWFVGNQSFPMSLALAMGCSVYQETFAKSPDCVFNRPNFLNQKTPIEAIQWT